MLVSLGIGKIGDKKICLAGSSNGTIYSLTPGDAKLIKTLGYTIKEK